MTIDAAVFAVSRTTLYPALLETGTGRMTTRRSYAEVFGAREPLLTLPWEGGGRRHWSRFWSHYLGAARHARRLGADAAWDHVVPLRRSDVPAVVGPGGTRAAVDVLVYPCAVSVVVRVAATGPWSLAELSGALGGLRRARQWGFEPGPANRSLDGVATDLRDAAASLLAQPAPEPGEERVLTVAAPTAGSGIATDFALTAEPVAACLAGLAALGPPGELRPERPLGANSNTNLGSRVYLLKAGHAIWNPSGLLTPSPADPIGCLHRNQTDLVTQVAALGAVVAWAAERIEAQVAVPIAVQPLVRNAAVRLEQLHAGLDGRTYRSGVARERVAPLLPAVTLVRATL